MSLFALNYKGILFLDLINNIPSTVLLFTSLIFLCQNYYIKPNHKSRMINTFINSSYSIYLWHFPLQLTFLIIIKFLNFDQSLFKNLIFFFIFLTFLFLISLISLKKFEIPCEKLIKKFAEK